MEGRIGDILRERARNERRRRRWAFERKAWSLVGEGLAVMVAGAFIFFGLPIIAAMFH